MKEPRFGLVEMHRHATATFDDLVRAVGDGQWGDPTPCPGWDVRMLVNHVTAENLWTPALLAGLTIDEVGSAYDGDVLGERPLTAWADALVAARTAVGSGGSADRIVHLSFADVPAAEYVWQLIADHAIHAWDLAAAIGADTRLDPELVAAVGGWFLSREDGYRQAGAVGPRPPVRHDDPPQDRLLAMFGRAVTEPVR
jgi:uncharacterized protein (TIGR03086 family)